MTAKKPSRLAEYVMSEQFHENARRGVAKAVAQTRAAGLTPAGNTHIKASTRPATVVTIEAPTPIRLKRRATK
ncbi:MAG: hypothetical protein ACN6OP_14520 [Pseudomonadales bacterium]